MKTRPYVLVHKCYNKKLCNHCSLRRCFVLTALVKPVEPAKFGVAGEVVGLGGLGGMENHNLDPYDHIWTLIP